MKIIDISMQINEDMPVYKNDKGKIPSITITRDFSQGAKTRESRLDLELHTGTHLDAPLHMIEGGQDSTFFKVDDMIVECRVLDFTGVSGGITDEDLKNKNIKKKEYILLKTKNSSDKSFIPDFTYLSETGAKYLVEKEVRGVGIDSLGIERSQPGHMTHKLLLGNGIYILEGLRLLHVEEGSYTLIAAPINIGKVEAAPVRALLLSK